MFLLDTNVVSELRKINSDRIDSNVLYWANSLDLSKCFLSVVTVAELERGVLLMDRKDPRQAKALYRWLQTVCVDFEERIIPIGSEIAHVWAELTAQKPRPYADAWIAATAKTWNLQLATRNTKDFDDMGVELINPWLPMGFADMLV